MANNPSVADAAEDELKSVVSAKSNGIFENLTYDLRAPTKVMLNTQIPLALFMHEGNRKMRQLDEIIFPKLNYSLSKPFSDFNSAYNDFYSAFYGNLGMWSGVFDGNQYSFPNCLTDKNKFLAIAKIAAEAINKGGKELGPLFEKVLATSNNLGEAIIDLQAATLEAKMDVSEIIAITKEIENAKEYLKLLKQEKQTTLSNKDFISKNSNNIARVNELILIRIQSLQVQLAEVQKKITELNSMNKKTTSTHTESTSSGWWIFKRGHDHTTTNTSETKTDVTPLISQQEYLTRQIATYQNQLNEVTNGAKVSLIADDTGLDERIKQTSDKIINLQRRQDVKVEKIVKAKIETIGIDEDTTLAFSRMLFIIRVLLQLMAPVASKLDTIRNIAVGSLTNDVLDPVDILRNLKGMYQCAILYDVITHDSPVTISDESFQDSLLGFVENTVRLNRVAAEKAPVERYVGRTEAISNDKIADDDLINSGMI